jgi:hypothetical protein
MPSTEIPDLWPTDLTGPAIFTPVVILRRQGEALGARTHNLVRGEVETRPTSNGTMFEHSFVLVAPLIRYRFPLLKVSHKVGGYPATLVETDLTRNQPTDNYWSAVVGDKAQLEVQLNSFFSQANVKAIIRSLIDQSSSPKTEDSIPPSLAP